ncbi:MAG: hypothetical protein ACRD8O_10025 [Bryobacteraceae bacterium]
MLSPSAFLIPSVAKDVTGVWMARRMQAMVGYGEGPHVASMTLLPVALVAVHTALEGPAGWRIAVAAVAVASVPLTNWLGGVALAAGVLALVMARNQARLGRVIAIGILGYALAMPWIKPSLMATVQRNSQLVGGYRMGAIQYAFLALWLCTAVAAGYLLKRTRLGQAWRFALVFLLLMAAPPLGFEWLRVYPIPQPDRYHLEMEFAIAIVLGLLLGQSRRWMLTPVAAGIAILLFVQAPRWRAFVRLHTAKFDVTKTLEWEAARWLDHNLPGARVFVTGSTQFWLNAFSGNPQLAGGFDQGRSNPQLADINYAIPDWQARGADSVLLLKAYGVRAVLVGGERTRDSYRNFRDPGQFSGLLRELWRSGDDVIYQVPARSDALARVVSREDLLRGPVMKPDFDRDALARYVAAIDRRDGPEPRLTWNGTGRIRIEAELQRDNVLSLPVTWDAGWRAEANGKSCGIWSDGLGLIAIAPACEGGCTIELIYDGGLQGKLARVIFALGIASCGAVLWFGRYRRGSSNRIMLSEPNRR